MPTFSVDDAPLKPLVLSLEQADAALGVPGISRPARARLIKRGMYPLPVKICGRLVVTTADVEEIITKAKISAAGDYERRRQQTRPAVEARAARRAERRELGQTDPAVAAWRRTRSS
jgi:uncharacterized protein (DUF2384 family)